MSRMRGTFSSVNRLAGQQRRGDDRQRGVLVPGGLNRTGQRATALDDVLYGRHLRGFGRAKYGLDDGSYLQVIA